MAVAVAVEPVAAVAVVLLVRMDTKMLNLKAMVAAVVAVLARTGMKTLNLAVAAVLAVAAALAVLLLALHRWLASMRMQTSSMRAKGILMVVIVMVMLLVVVMRTNTRTSLQCNFML